MLKLNRKDWILGISIVLGYIAVGIFTLKGYGSGIDSVTCFGAGDTYWLYYTGKISLPTLAKIIGIPFDPPFLYVVEAIPWFLFPVAGGVYWDLSIGFRYTESWLISHSLLIPVFAGLALLVVYYFASKVYGRFAAVSATLSLAFLPVFFGEAHLDMKDVPFAALYALTIILFWKGVTEKNWKWIASSSIVFGLTLASRIMAFTVLFVIYSWLLLTQLHKINLKSKLTISLLFYPVIGIAIFFLAWSWLWLDPINNLLAVSRYFQNRNWAVLYFGQILYTQKNLPWHYAIVMLAVTTPIPILLLAITGGVSALKRSWSFKDEASILVLLWFGVSIIRSSLPSIFPVYNGTSLFTEVIPAFCILAGIGASWIYTYIRSHSIRHPNSQHLVKMLSAALIIGLITVPSFIAMYQIHPYEMSYYNELVGGVKGAYGKFDVDYWWQAYSEGARWLNEYAHINTTILIAPYRLWYLYYFTRSDLKIIDSTYFERRVDYIMFNPNFYLWYNRVIDYCRKNLKPAHIIRIEGAPVLHIYNTTSFDITQMPGAPTHP